MTTTEAPQKKKRRRWPWILLGLFAIIVVAAALSGGDGDEVEAGDEATATTAAPDEPTETSVPGGSALAVGESATIDGVTFTVNGLRVDEGDEFLAPEEGQKWVLVDATIDNGTDEAYSSSTLLEMTLRVDGRSLDVAIGPDTQGSLDTTVGAGSSVSGEVAFEAAADATEAEFVWQPASLTSSEQAVWTVELP